ncbi:helix-turn-helix domain-containing protein [Modestobacter italicus]|uniref:helix-turn-helix domain-containing protein n=1 Tax=Modestobacter italicus (strain DSM 44449 / CECT 9708 / BC 501) TaxID=2732864 RepID=UPI001C98B2A0|nr:AraC family transcriptional regulator [Modestobacter italicus]
MLAESVVHRPPPALRPFVAEVVGYRHEGLTPGLHRGLPSPHLTLVLTLDEPLVMAAHPDPGQAASAHDALVGGLHTAPALIATGNRQFGVQLSLTPLGARALLGMPAGALASLDVELADLLGPAAGELLDRLRTAADWPGRFAALDAALPRLLPDRLAFPAPELTEAWALTTRAAGRLGVAAIAARVGWSDRYLRQRFTAEFGLTPKEAARVARFSVARRRLAAAVARGRAPDLAVLAAAHGYADQSHLTREWRALAGLPPRRWLAAEHQLLRPDTDDLLRYVQDGRTPVSAP